MQCDQMLTNMRFRLFLIHPKIVVVVVVDDAHIYPPVTGQRQTLTVGRSANFSLQRLLRAWRNPHLLRSFRRSNVSVDFFKFLPTEFAACSKPPSRDNHRQAFTDKIPNWTKSRIEQNPERTKSRIGQNPEWTKSRIGQNPE